MYSMKTAVVLAVLVVLGLLTIVFLRRDVDSDRREHHAVQTSSGLDEPRFATEPLVPNSAGQQERSSVPWPAPGTIHGVVTDGSGAPILGASIVSVALPEHRFRVTTARGVSAPTFAASTDDGGRYQLAVPPAYLQHLKVTAPGWATAFADARAGERVDFQLEPESRLVVVVRSEEGAFVPAARVRLRFAESPIHELRGETDGDGRLELSGVPPFEATLVVDHDEHSRFESQLEIPPDREETIDVVLERGATVEGIVRDLRTGEPLAGGSVSLHYLPHKSVVAGVDGRFHLGGVPHGQWDIVARADSYGTEVRYVDSDGESDLELEFDLADGREIVGRVFGPDGALRGVRVLAAADYDSGRSVERDLAGAETRETGEFRVGWLRLDVDHELLFSHPEYARKIVVVSAGGGASVDIGDVMLGESRILAGEVVEPSARPVPGVSVKLEGGPTITMDTGGGSTPRRGALGSATPFLPPVFGRERVLTRDDGRFDFRGLPSGSYTITTRGSGTVPTTRTLRLTADALETTIVVERGARVTGVVLSKEESLPIAGARIECEQMLLATDVDGTRQGSTQFRDRTGTDSMGRFALSGVPAGRLQVTITHREFVSASKEIDLPPGVVGKEVGPIRLESRARIAAHEANRLGRALGWTAAETARVVDLYRSEQGERARRDGLVAIVGVEEAARADEYSFREESARMEEAILGQLDEIVSDALSGNAAGDVGPEDIRTLLVDGTRRVLSIWREDGRAGLRDHDSWRGRQERQQAVADRLGAELRDRLSADAADSLLRRWKRVQPFIFAR